MRIIYKKRPNTSSPNLCGCVNSCVLYVGDSPTFTRAWMNEHVHANVIGWSRMSCQVPLYVSTQKGARQFMSACSWLFFLFFFFSLSIRQRRSTEGGREGGRDRRGGRESMSGMMGQGRGRGKVELTGTTINSLLWCGGESLLAGLPPMSRLFECVRLPCSKQCVCVCV